jgi:hypothetical protein
VAARPALELDVECDRGGIVIVRSNTPTSCLKSLGPATIWRLDVTSDVIRFEPRPEPRPRRAGVALSARTADTGWRLHKGRPPPQRPEPPSDQTARHFAGRTPRGNGPGGWLSPSR